MKGNRSGQAEIRSAISAIVTGMKVSCTVGIAGSVSVNGTIIAGCRAIVLPGGIWPRLG
jgi:hypothetical protein